MGLGIVEIAMKALPMCIYRIKTEPRMGGDRIEVSRLHGIFLGAKLPAIYTGKMPVPFPDITIKMGLCPVCQLCGRDFVESLDIA